MDGRNTRVRLQPPRMGEHTRAVLAEAGYRRAQIDELIYQRVVIAPASTSINAVKEN
jgi:crotonobetainyl-CoA:carnitine CoA-transferase CaiB-like acyl-CoA transferase